jgi:hypothetical protein
MTTRRGFLLSLAGALGLATAFSPGGIESEWTRYQGPLGGRGWKNARTGKIAYQKDKPAE